MFSKDALDRKAEDILVGQVVWKEAVRQLRSMFNVPVYVLEYLSAMYIDYSDDTSYKESIDSIKSMLTRYLVKPDEAEFFKKELMKHGALRIIDHISVYSRLKKNRLEATIENIGLKNVPIPQNIVDKYPRLLGGGIWARIDLVYIPDSDDKVFVKEVTPIQLPRVDLDEYVEARSQFTKEEWMALLLRSIGMEPYARGMTQRRWLLYLLRLIPLVEPNYNLVELGPRATGKSFVYREVSPYAVLVSGGRATVARIFYNIRTSQMGLVGYYDTLAFDEVAGLQFNDSYAIQMFKDYMESGGFSRGTEEKRAEASIVFNGNINDPIDVLLRVAHLFQPFPKSMQDIALLDRIHAYLPGWEMPKLSSYHFTSHFGLANDYFSVIMHELRKYSYGDVPEKYFDYGSHIKHRDRRAINKTVSGLIKLIYPNESFTKEDIRELVHFAMEMRLRVKWQLNLMSEDTNEYADVDFTYIDMDTEQEYRVELPEIVALDSVDTH